MSRSTVTLNLNERTVLALLTKPSWIPGAYKTSMLNDNERTEQQMSVSFLLQLI
jgi:hypothetical protein